MNRPTKKDLWLLAAQITVWAVVLLLAPLTTWLTTRQWATTLLAASIVFGLLRSPLVLYFANFYLLGPYLYERRRYKTFALVNLLAIVGMNYFVFYMKEYTEKAGVDMPANAWIGMGAGFFAYFLLNCAAIAAALVLRHFIRTRLLKQQLQEERQKNTEAELAWLKNQINPHFLFNTLNNISSLTQIDPDRAQDAISQLSDLLRYAMYETNKPTVPIQGEVEFMRNYIELMKLRCNERAEVTYHLSLITYHSEIAPLLFISLIENAFKHGLSSSRDSKIDIRLEQKVDNTLVFTCDNTNYPKTDADRSGSGIGIENTRRRLELIYPGRYQWEQSLQGNIYHVRITLNIEH